MLSRTTPNTDTSYAVRVKQVEVVEEVFLPDIYNLNDSVMNKKQEDQIKLYPEKILLKKENGFAVVSYICFYYH